MLVDPASAALGACTAPLPTTPLHTTPVSLLPLARRRPSDSHHHLAPLLTRSPQVETFLNLGSCFLRVATNRTAAEPASGGEVDYQQLLDFQGLSSQLFSEGLASGAAGMRLDQAFVQVGASGAEKGGHTITVPEIKTRDQWERLQRGCAWGRLCVRGVPAEGSRGCESCGEGALTSLLSSAPAPPPTPALMSSPHLPRPAPCFPATQSIPHSSPHLPCPLLPAARPDCAGAGAGGAAAADTRGAGCSPAGGSLPPGRP